MKIDNIDLSKFDETIAKAGVVELKEDDLMEFAANTLMYEMNLEDKEELDDDMKRKLEFYNNGKQYGLYIKLNEDNLMVLETEDDDEGNKIKIRAKLVKGEGDQRIRLVIRTRRSWVGCFLGIRYFTLLNELSDSSESFIWVGGLQTQYKNLRSQEYEKDSELDPDERYSDFPTFTFNLWQIVHITKKGKSLDLIYHPKPEIE